MEKDLLVKKWKKEEEIAHIKGWDFSHIQDKCKEDKLPWSYKDEIFKYIKKDYKILDIDTGGGEFLLSLNHPYDNLYCTEGYDNNVKLCKEKLIPLGIHFTECNDVNNINFKNNSFDMIINRHGDIGIKEISRLLKNGGLFITEQVGCYNDRDLVERLLGSIPIPFPNNQLNNICNDLENNNFKIIKSENAYRSIKFYDTGALVWFAKIIEWEFISFNVDRCVNQLIEIENEIQNNGFIEGTIHRFLIVSKKGE